MKYQLLDFDELEIEQKALGSGNFGAVYRGSFRGAAVAVKQLFAQVGTVVVLAVAAVVSLFDFVCKFAFTSNFLLWCNVLSHVESS